MPIRLISKQEKFSYEYEGSTFYYRRVDAQTLNTLRRKYTDRKGRLDDIGFGKELLENYIVGWDNVIGEDNKPVKFEPKLIHLLPNPVLVDLISLINGEQVDEQLTGEELEKN